MLQHDGKWMIAQGSRDLNNTIFEDVDDAVGQKWGHQFKQRWRKHSQRKEDVTYVRIG